MLFKSSAVVALLAIASHAVAEEEKMPYKPIMKMSLHQGFGLNGRQASGYLPTQTLCNNGTTCEDACGPAFTECASTDGQTHCFEPSLNQQCCTDGSGNSCDAGYFCTLDTQGQTWCCPQGQSLAQCAALYTITGSLVSETTAPLTTSTSSVSITTSYGGNVSVTTDVETDYTTVCPSASATISYKGSNSTVKATTPATVPTISTVPIAGAGLTVPSIASAFVVAAAALVAAVL